MTEIMNKISPQKWQAFAFTCLLGYVLSAFSSPSIYHVFSIFIILGCLITICLNFKHLVKEPLFIIFLLVIVTQIISWFLSLQALGHIAADHPKIDRLARLFLFIPLAYWLKGSKRKIFFLWGCYFLALIAACLSSPTLSQDLTNLTNGIRVDFSIKNAMYTSIISGICALVSIYFTTQYFFQNGKNKNFVLFCVNIIIFLISSIILVGSQSRQVFVAYAVVLLCTPIFLLLSFKACRRVRNKILASYILIPIVIFALFQQSAIKERFNEESTTIVNILEGHIDNIPMNSAGIRFNSWIEASKWITSYPFFGIGNTGPKAIIKSSKLFQAHLDNSTIKGLQHFHNNHIDMLVSYGVVGWLLTLSIYPIILIYLYKIKEKIKDGESWLFLCLLLTTFWVVVNFFESYNLRTYGVLTQNIFMAVFFSIYLKYKELD